MQSGEAWCARAGVRQWRWTWAAQVPRIRCDCNHGIEAWGRHDNQVISSGVKCPGFVLSEYSLYPTILKNLCRLSAHHIADIVWKWRPARLMSNLYNSFHLKSQRSRRYESLKLIKWSQKGDIMALLVFSYIFFYRLYKLGAANALWRALLVCVLVVVCVRAVDCALT